MKMRQTWMEGLSERRNELRGMTEISSKIDHRETVGAGRKDKRCRGTDGEQV